MALRTVLGDEPLPLAARGTGTHTSPPIIAGGGVADVMVAVHVTAVTGTSPTLVVSVEQSNDGTSWSTVAGGGTATISAVGNTACNATITQSFARVVATVGGTTPSFTCRVAVLVFAE